VDLRLQEIAETAVARAEAGDTGDPLWWKAGFVSSDFGVGNLITSVQGMRVFNERRLLAPEEGVDGAAYITTEVRYADEDAPEPVLSGGTMQITVIFKTPGPSATDFAQRLAQHFAATLRAYLVLAAGLVFDGPSMFIFPAEETQRATAERRLAEGVPELWFLSDDRARQVPIWPALQRLGPSIELHERIRGFLGCYETAIVQRNGSAATAFLVAAIEAIATPPVPWRKEQVVQRFTSFLREVAPDSLERVMTHPNFAEAFGPKKSAKAFADHLYDLRSRPFHGALRPAPAHDVVNPEGIRVALASEVARDTLARFLEVPRSSLVGHPMTAAPD